jgi:hypothetical protein
MVLLALPSADHLLIERDPGQFVPYPFGCAPRSVETARDLRLPLRVADFFAARLDRFLAMASLHCALPT